MRELLRRAKARLFGRSSEKLDHLQGTLLLGEEDVRVEELDLEAAAGGAPEGAGALAAEEDTERQEKKKREYKKRHPGRAALPAHLERVVKEVRVEEEHRGCPKCGCAMEVIGHECREELDLVPAHYVVQVIRREKLACRNRGCEGGYVRTAPMPPKAMERAKASDALIAHLAVAKYADHLPVYRQVVAMRREGCMAHARRGFAEAMKAGDARGLPVVEMIGDLYALESFARENRLNAEERLSMRLSHSAEIFERIHRRPIG